VEARDSGVLDFHRISPQRPLALTVGFVLGGPVREWLLFACALPFSLALALLADISFVSWLAIMLAFTITALFYHLVAVVIALSVPELRGGAAGIVLVILFFNMQAIPIALMGGFPLGHLTAIPTIAVALDPGTAKDILPASLPHHALTAFFLALLYQFPLAFFTMLAIERKMRDQAAAAYTKPTAVLFYLTTCALVVLGAAMAPTPTYEWDSMPIAWTTYSLLLIGFVLLVAITPNRTQFFRGFRQARKAGLTGPPIWSEGAVNWTVTFCFAALLFGSSLLAHAVSAGGKGVGLNTLAGTAVAVFTLFFFSFAKQAFDLSYGKIARTYLGALIFALWGLPLLLAMLIAITGDPGDIVEAILAVSPIPGIYLALSEPIRHTLPVTTGVALIASFIPALGFALLNPGQMRRAQEQLEQAQS
jgi:hypothetical protein